MPVPRAQPQPLILILIANGFEEETVAPCLSQLRAAGVAVSLVGASAGLISSLHGLSVLPDFTLDRLGGSMPASMVVVPGAQQCVALLMADPRVHDLMSEVLRQGNYVAAFSAAQATLERAGLPLADEPSRYLVQGSQTTREFVTQLVHLAVSVRS